jgi:uncharacterized membrane protein
MLTRDNGNLRKQTTVVRVPVSAYTLFLFGYSPTLNCTVHLRIHCLIIVFKFIFSPLAWLEMRVTQIRGGADKS